MNDLCCLPRRVLAAVGLVIALQVAGVGSEFQPPSAESIYRSAPLVVRGQIIDFKIGTVEHFEGSDWAISAKIAVDEVIKGDFRGDVLHAKCFRPKMRDVETWGCATPQIPVPEVGVPVVVYLTPRDEEFHVMSPIGFQSLEDAEITIAKVNAGQAAEEDESGGHRDSDESNASVIGDLPRDGSPGFQTAAVVEELEFEDRTKVASRIGSLVLIGLIGAAVGLFFSSLILPKSSRRAVRLFAGGLLVVVLLGGFAVAL